MARKLTRLEQHGETPQPSSQGNKSAIRGVRRWSTSRFRADPPESSSPVIALRPVCAEPKNEALDLPRTYFEQKMSARPGVLDWRPY